MVFVPSGITLKPQSFNIFRQQYVWNVGILKTFTTSLVIFVKWEIIILL